MIAICGGWDQGSDMAINLLMMDSVKWCCGSLFVVTNRFGEKCCGFLLFVDNAGSMKYYACNSFLLQ